MAQTITAVYENEMFRPLTPLTLPEHSQVELDVRVIAHESAAARRERARSALTAAGLLAVVAAPDASTDMPVKPGSRDNCGPRFFTTTP